MTMNQNDPKSTFEHPSTERLTKAAREYEPGVDDIPDDYDLTVRVRNLVVDREAMVAAIDGKIVNLSRSEIRLLCLMASKPNKMWAKQDLCRRLWDWKINPKSRTLDSHACRLRKKLVAAGMKGEVILAGQGFGYALVREVPK